VRYRFYDFGAEQPPADIAFAIDLSGSMNATIPSEGVSRLVVAQDRARMFVDEIEPAEGNRLGVFGFSTGMSNKSDFLGVWKRVSPAGTVAAILSDTGVIFPFTELVSSATQSSARLAISGPGVTASGCTPIGQGLLRAKSELLSLVTPIGDDPHHKAIVLFSDGMQNIAPFVKEAPSWPCGTSSLPLIDAEKTFKDNTPTLPVYSVFFGSEGESIWNHQLMLHIQEQTGGDYLYYTVDSLELAAAYFQIRHLVASNALLFLEQEGEVTTPGWDTPVTVHFDSAADVATVAVAWPVSKDIELTVEGRRQGEDDSAWKELSEQPQPGDTSTPLATTAARLPGPTGAYRVYRFIPGPSTTWELRVGRPLQTITENTTTIAAPTTTDYALAVYAPSEEARMKASLGAERFTVGEALPIFADLRFVGHPIAGATVMAKVTVPVSSSSNVLRRFAGQLAVDNSQPDSTVPGLAAQLRKLVGGAGIITNRVVDVTLRDDGTGGDAKASDGVYTGRLGSADTTAAGLYEVVVTATGTLPSGTDFERSEKLGAVAAVGPADPARTEVRFGDRVALGGGLFGVDVTVLAVDTFGNATYPGAAGAIAVTPQPGGGSNLGGVTDNLDSSYTQRVKVEEGQDVVVDVSVGDVGIGSFDEGAGVGPAPLGLSWSLHLGAAYPHGSFGSVFDPGPSLAIDLEYRFNRRFAVRAELGWNEFDAIVGPDLTLVHLVPYLQYRRPGGTWEPYVEAGIGLYDLEIVGSAGGFALGAGAQRAIAPNWRLDLGVHSHHAGGSLDLSYSQLAVGILYTSP
jgi:hypothetical protein